VRAYLSPYTILTGGEGVVVGSDCTQPRGSSDAAAVERLLLRCCWDRDAPRAYLCHVMQWCEHALSLLCCALACIHAPSLRAPVLSLRSRPHSQVLCASARSHRVARRSAPASQRLRISASPRRPPAQPPCVGARRWPEDKSSRARSNPKSCEFVRKTSAVRRGPSARWITFRPEA